MPRMGLLTAYKYRLPAGTGAEGIEKKDNDLFYAANFVIQFSAFTLRFF